MRRTQWLACDDPGCRTSNGWSWAFSPTWPHSVHQRCFSGRPVYKPRGQRLAWTACAVRFVHSGAASAIYNVRSTINVRAWWC
jgi:hypothetical protein